MALSPCVKKDPKPYYVLLLNRFSDVSTGTKKRVDKNPQMIDKTVGFLPLACKFIKVSAGLFRMVGPCCIFTHFLLYFIVQIVLCTSSAHAATLAGTKRSSISTE